MKWLHLYRPVQTAQLAERYELTMTLMEAESESEEFAWEECRGAIQGGRGVGHGERGAGHGGRGVGRGRSGASPRGRERQTPTTITDAMQATVTDHVIVHGMTMTEAGLSVLPNRSRCSVVTIIWTVKTTQKVLYCIAMLVTTIDFYNIVGYNWFYFSSYIVKHVRWFFWMHVVFCCCYSRIHTSQYCNYSVRLWPRTTQRLKVL